MRLKTIRTAALGRRKSQRALSVAAIGGAIIERTIFHLSFVVKFQSISFLPPFLNWSILDRYIPIPRRFNGKLAFSGIFYSIPKRSRSAFKFSGAHHSAAASVVQQHDLYISAKLFFLSGKVLRGILPARKRKNVIPNFRVLHVHHFVVWQLSSKSSNFGTKNSGFRYLII